MIGKDVTEEGWMDLGIIALAAYLNGAQPIELWRTRLPFAYVELRVFNRTLYAPSYIYFENMKSGCNIVATDAEGLITCKMVVEEMDKLSTMIVNELRYASITRFGSERFTWRDTVKTAQSNAERFHTLYEPLIKQFPMLHVIGLGGLKIRA